MNKKIAIGLYSGGLDSILACKLIAEEDFYLILLQYKSPVFGGREDSLQLSDFLPSGGFRLQTIEMREEFIAMLQSPKFGYGKNMNPCLDCKILMAQKARQIMIENRGSFVFTGEVVGQRPMSQRKDALRIIERESGLDKHLLRPLSAQLLPPTLAEERGVINREKLLNISGRSRKRQKELAEKKGITGYPNSSGGCLLTDKSFSLRLKSILYNEKARIGLEDLQLLKVGRHFSLRPGVKCIVGRNQTENEKILSLGRESDWVFKVTDGPGPITLAKGSLQEDDFQWIASITARYSDLKGEDRVFVKRQMKGKTIGFVFPVRPATEEFLEKCKVS